MAPSCTIKRAITQASLISPIALTALSTPTPPLPFSPPLHYRLRASTKLHRAICAFKNAVSSEETTAAQQRIEVAKGELRGIAGEEKVAKVIQQVEERAAMRETRRTRGLRIDGPKVIDEKKEDGKKREHRRKKTKRGGWKKRGVKKGEEWADQNDNQTRGWFVDRPGGPLPDLGKAIFLSTDSQSEIGTCPVGAPSESIVKSSVPVSTPTPIPTRTESQPSTRSIIPLPPPFPPHPIFPIPERYHLYYHSLLPHHPASPPPPLPPKSVNPSDPSRGLYLSPERLAELAELERKIQMLLDERVAEAVSGETVRDMELLVEVRRQDNEGDVEGRMWEVERNFLENILRGR